MSGGRNYRGLLSISIDKETEGLLNQMRESGVAINVSEVCRDAIREFAAKSLSAEQSGEAIVRMVFLGTTGGKE